MAGLGGYHDRLATQATGGNAPDLFQIDDTLLAEYAGRDILLDLTRYVADDRLDLREVPEQLARYGRVDERAVGVPAAQTSAALVFNRRLLRRLGQPEPRTGMSWKEYVNWAARVTRASGNRVAGTMDASGDYRAFWLWLRGEGSELYQGGSSASLRRAARLVRVLGGGALRPGHTERRPGRAGRQRRAGPPARGHRAHRCLLRLVAPAARVAGPDRRRAGRGGLPGRRPPSGPGRRCTGPVSGAPATRTRWWTCSTS
ncbi:extracellular solute-binding protein [Micromonospora sp. BRA006-A]|nr:extracellular solute-binding protein [Micromonospora sp. BRA006-A]